MVTMAQRIEALRTERNIGRALLSTTLGFPRSALDKFETGRQTPTQAQQQKLAEYFGVSLAYLRGEVDERGGDETWLERVYEEESAPAPTPAPRKAAPVVVQSAGSNQDGSVFNALLNSKSFQTMVRTTVLEVLRSPEGQELLQKAIRKELDRR